MAAVTNPKWTIPFKSFNNISCRVDILDMTDVNPSSAAVQLVGGEHPVTWQESDDEDLLNVIRTKTGYINIVETAATAQEIEAMKPSANTDRKVKVWYGSTLLFVGFMQAQSFENRWESAPREMSFPIFSPLSLADEIDMPVYNPPSKVALCTLIADVVDALNTVGAEYATVIWPEESVLINVAVNSLNVCPFNTDHTPAYAPGTDNPLFSPVSLRWTLEAVCNAFGWMLHETADTLLFTKFDQTGYFLQCTAANIRNYTSVARTSYTGGDQYPLNINITPADDDGKESLLMPYERIVVEYDGEYTRRATFDFNHTEYRAKRDSNGSYAAFLESVSPELSGNYLLIINEMINGVIQSQGVNACKCGNQLNQRTCLLFNLPDDNTMSGDLCTLKFYDRPIGNAMRFSFSIEWGATPATLGTDSSVEHKEVGAYFKVGRLYYHGSGQWTPEAITDVTDSKELVVDNCPDEMPIEIHFRQVYQPTSGRRVPLVAVKDMVLEEQEVLYSEYTDDETNKDVIKGSAGNGKGEGTVNQGLTCYRKRSNSIGSTMVYPANWFTKYQYVRQSREQLVVKCRISNLPTTLAYSLWSEFANKNWRLIGLSFDLWNDEVTVMLQRVISSS